MYLCVLSYVHINNYFPFFSDVIKREIVAIAVGKGQLTNNVASRKSACRLLGKIATKLDAQALRQDVLPTTLALCQVI